MNINLSTSAVLVNVFIGTWGATKLDKSAAQELDQEKGATVSTAKVTKDLLPGCSELAQVKSIAGKMGNTWRMWTYPWEDNGARLLPTARLFKFQETWSELYAEHSARVDALIVQYNNAVQQASLTMGEFFNPADYPSPSDIRGKCYVRMRTSPVPSAGDFRVDLGTQANELLRKDFEESMALQMQEVGRDSWEKMYALASRFSNQLREGGKIYESTYDQLVDVVDVLRSFNPSNDPDLSARATELLNVMSCTDAKELKKDTGVRSAIKQDIDDILSKFNF